MKKLNLKYGLINDLKYNLKNKIGKFINDEGGMGVVEIVLIILVLIGLAVLFKSNINDVVKGALTSIKNQAREFY